MAHTVQNMNRKSGSKSIFSKVAPPKAAHLKPLSVYSRMVMCEVKDSPGPNSDSFVNFQVEIVNNCVKKRRQDDSSLNDAPFKKPCSMNAMSPDLGCFVDYCSPPARKDSLTTLAPSHPPFSGNTQARKWEVKKTVSSRHCRMDEGESVQLSPKSEKHLINISHSFDNDVDDILCLNPLRKDQHKETKTDRGSVEEDKGYVSSFHQNENEEERNAESSPESQCHGQHFPFSNKDCSVSANGPQLDPVKPATIFLEEDEVLNIGQPIFESSVCQPKAADEQRSQLSEIHEESFLCQTHNAWYSGGDTSYETTLPLQVQVKSKVVVPNDPDCVNKLSSAPPREPKANSANKNRDRTDQTAKSRSQRSKIYHTKVEWERQKRQYVFSVTSHMSEKQAVAQGFMTELLDLMTHVAGQTGSSGSQWQHPSDLTCRNYQKRFGNDTPTMTLSEWQAQNSKGYKRFCRVPKIFERSPFP